MIQINIRATLQSPLCHLSGEQHVWFENGNRTQKRVLRLHMRKHLIHQSEDNVQPILVPMYQGNSWRGLLRYHLGLTVLDQLTDLGVPITKDLFSIFLSSGGMISAKADKATHDLHTFYEQYPTYWLLGGTFNGKLYRGHSAIGDWIPVCLEAITNHSLPQALTDQAVTINGLSLSDSHRTPLTNITQITRRDPKLRPDLLALVHDEELAEMLDDYKKGKESRTKAKAPKAPAEHTTDESESETGKQAAEQQIIATETVMEGTPFFGQMSILNGEGIPSKWKHLEKIGFGCLLIAMERFGQTPFIGGGYRQGFGRINFALDVALSPTQLITDAVTLTHINGYPLFTVHPDLSSYVKDAHEALGALVNRIKKEQKS